MFDDYLKTFTTFFSSCCIKFPVQRNTEENHIPQNFLSPELQKLRQEKKDPTNALDQEHLLKRRIAKAELAAKVLGHCERKAKGTTGTTIIATDIGGKPVYVYKCSKSVSLANRVKNFFKMYFGGQMSYLTNKEFVKAEVAAYLLDQGIGFHLAPATQTANQDGGIIQAFARTVVVDGNKYKYQEAKTLIEKDATLYTEDENTLFQKFIVFDYLIGNLDRHEENWLVALNDKKEIVSIKAIDNANSFPKKHPLKGALASRNRYLWKNRSIASNKFTVQLREFVRQNLTDEKIRSFLDETDKQLDHFLDEDMKEHFLKRVEVVRKLIEVAEPNPQSLAAISSYEEMALFLNNQTPPPNL
jgi:Phosphatidylinositol 3- and 4-kinase